MRIHSDKLTREDLNRAAGMARVTLLQCDTQISRKRAQAWEVTLGGLSKSRTQRFRDERAATYRQWGTFLAVLFDKDPEMVAGQYDGVASFDSLTRYAFDAEPYVTDGDDRVAAHLRDENNISGVRIVSCERMRSSSNGNPRFRVTLSNGESHPTSPDAMCAYGIENREYRENDCVVTLDARRHIMGVRVMLAV